MLKKMVKLLTVVMLMIGTTTSAQAENFAYTAVNGGTVYVENYLVMDSTANVPNVTFKYSITAGAAQVASGTNARVFAGNDANFVSGTPSIGASTFATNTETFTTVQAIETTDTATVSGKQDPITLQTGKKYARSKFSVNFSQVSFREPGIYRYLITETAGTFASASNTTPISTATGISNDSDTSRVLDVYITDKNDGSNTLQVAGYVLHNSNDAAVVPATYPSGEPSTKTNGFVNTMSTVDLTISMASTGNQASRDEFFEVSITISGGTASQKYDVDLSNASATTAITGYNPTSHTNPSYITLNGSGTATVSFWLQNGQSITIQGLAPETAYSVNQTKLTLDTEGYVASATISGDTTSGGSAISMNASTTALSDNGITADTTIAYTNTKAGSVPTGILTSTIPGIAIIGIAVCTMYIVAKLKKV